MSPSSNPSRPTHRRRWLVSVLAVVAVVGVVVPAHEQRASAATVVYSGAGSAPRIGVIGDSVMAAIRWYGTWTPLREFNYTVDVESCRRTSIASCRGREGFAPDNTVQAIRRLGSRLGDVLVVGTGYDDPHWTFASAVDAVMDAAASAGIRTVVWTTMRVNGVAYSAPGGVANAATYRQNNQILYSKAAQYGGRLVVADWAGYSASRSDWVTRDGIHLTPSGATAMAAFIAAQARAQMGQPLELRAAVAPATGVGSNQVLLMWERPLFSNGRVVTDYRVQYAVGRDGPWVTISDHVSAQRWLLVFGLTNGQVYRFRVAAYSAAGWGPYSAPVSATPRVALPGAPSSVAVAVSPSPGVGSGQVLLSWPIPFAGGRTITDYQVDVAVDGGSWQTFADGVRPNRWALVSGLVDGRVYSFRVRAWTSAGWGPWSSPVRATPRVALPGAPVVAAEPRAGGVMLSWPIPFAGGRTITDYQVDVAVDGGSWHTFVDGVRPNRWAYVPGDGGVPHQFRVRAWTSAGWGPWSSVVTATPLAAAVAPASLLPEESVPESLLPEESVPEESVPESSLPALVTVGDVVWLDADGDGVQDVGEDGVPGVTVRVVAGDDPDVVVDETVTDASGRYELSVDPSRDVRVLVVVPDGYLPTVWRAVDGGSDPEARDSDADPVTLRGQDDPDEETTVEVVVDLGGVAVATDTDVGLVVVPDDTATTTTSTTSTIPTTSTTVASTTATTTSTTSTIPTTSTTAAPTTTTTVAPTTTAVPSTTETIPTTPTTPEPATTEAP